MTERLRGPRGVARAAVETAEHSQTPSRRVSQIFFSGLSGLWRSVLRRMSCQLGALPDLVGVTGAIAFASRRVRSSRALRRLKGRQPGGRERHCFATITITSSSSARWPPLLQADHGGLDARRDSRGRSGGACVAAGIHQRTNCRPTVGPRRFLCPSQSPKAQRTV
jgi:hypothetical protein